MTKVTDVDVDKFMAECGICGEMIEDCDRFNGDTANKAIAEYFNSVGWEKIESEKFGCVCLACPRCASMNDDERGE